MREKVKCTHPDHVDGQSCEDRAVGCHPDCECCMGKPVCGSCEFFTGEECDGKYEGNETYYDSKACDWYERR